MEPMSAEDELRQMVDSLGLPEPTNEANVQLLTELQLDERFRDVTEQLLRRGEALEPKTEQGRDLHSLRSAYLLEMKRRGMR